MARCGFLFLGVVALLTACSHSARRPSPSPTTMAAPSDGAAEVAKTPLPTAFMAPAAGSPAGSSTTAGAASMGLYDVGQLLVPNGHPVQVSNRTALVVVNAMTGDLFRVPPGARPASPPGVGLNPAYYLSFGTTVRGQGLYIYVSGQGIGPHFAPVDGMTYRAQSDGDVVVSVFDFLNGIKPAVDHTSVINGFGHLLIDANPVPASAAVYYNTGEGLDVSGARRIGTLPSDLMPYVRTTCDRDACSLYGGDNRAPVAGTVECGDTVNLVTDRFRLTFERGWLSPHRATPPPGQCEPGMRVQAGDLVAAPYTPVFVRAYSLDGQPLSIVVAGDGTLYVGNIVPRFTCGPCRGK